MNRATSTLFALFVGTAAGVFMGILYAPEKGENTRDKLNYQLTKYRDRLKELIDDLVEGRHDTKSNYAKSEGQRVIDDAREKAERLLGDVEELMDQIKSRK